MSAAAAPTPAISADVSFHPFRYIQPASLRSGGATGYPGDQPPGPLKAPSVRLSQCAAFQRLNQFMGLSFSMGGWGESRHFIGLDRPALQRLIARVFHGLSLVFLPSAETATDRNTAFHLLQEPR